VLGERSSLDGKEPAGLPGSPWHATGCRPDVPPQTLTSQERGVAPIEACPPTGPVLVPTR